MNADGEARGSVVGEHPLPDRRLRQRRRRSGRTEGQRELSLVAAGAGHALRPRYEPELPEQRAPRLFEAVARAGDNERLERMLRQLRPLREVADVRIGTVSLTLVAHCVRLVLADAVDVV